GIARGEEPAVDLGDRALVEPAGRLAGDDETRAGGKAAADDQLLHVAAGEKPGALGEPLAAHVEGAHHLAREAPRPRAAEEAEALERGIGEPLDDSVFPERHVPDHAFGMAVLGNAGDAGGDEAMRRRMTDRLAEQADG